MKFLRQNTQTTISVGPFFGTDGLTPMNGIAVPAQATSGTATVGYLYLQNTTSVALSAAAIGTWTAIGIGLYNLTLQASDLNFAGRGRLVLVNGASYDYVEEDFVVLPAAVYDGLFGATAGLPALPAAGSIATASFAAAVTIPDARFANLDAAVSSRSTYAGGAVASVTAPVTVGTNNDKTGYSVGNVLDKTGYALASNGLDAITATMPAGVATTFPGMVVQLWRRFFKGSDRNKTTGLIRTFADDGVTVNTTQTFTDDGLGDETLGAAS
jgi:hypothetical protein